MGKFHINKLTFTGTKGISEIKFGENLTLIFGPSDTGKTYVFKSIYYLLGSSNKNAPFDISIGYDTITMEVRKNNSHITLTRKISENKILVNDGIKNKIYKVSGKKDNIREVFSEILDIPISLQVPKNEDGQTETFSLRTLKPLLFVHEDNTELEKPILIPDIIQNTTAFLSCLLYILYEQDYSEFDAEENKRTKAAKRAAVQKYIISNKEKFLKQKDSLEKFLSEKNEDNTYLESLIEELQNELDKTNLLISSTINDIRNVSSEITKKEDLIRTRKITQNRYKALESQYIADIERLGFIIQGEDIIHKHESPHNCPFCNGELEKEQEASYLESSRAEVVKILNNSMSLSQTLIDIDSEVSNYIDALEDLKKKKKSIDDLLSTELKPQKVSITQKISQYSAYVKASNDLELINSLLDNFESDLSHLDSTVSEKRAYKPKELFADDFISTINKTYLAILKSCNYTPANSAEFDLSKLDIIINGDDKKTHGKGVRALLNSIMILSMREYINEVAIKNPHFYLLDSPLHGIQMPEGVQQDENVRKGFFNYVINNYGDDQIIIMENIVPGDFSKDISTDPNISIIEFTKNENKGRYGLLKGIRKN